MGGPHVTLTGTAARSGGLLEAAGSSLVGCWGRPTSGSRDDAPSGDREGTCPGEGVKQGVSAHDLAVADHGEANHLDHRRGWVSSW